MVPEGFVQKHLLREAFRGSLPEQIIGRGKQGLKPPCSDWLRKELKLFWYDRVVVRGALVGTFLEKKALQTLFYEHQSCKADHNAEMWNLLMFELWHARSGDSLVSAG